MNKLLASLIIISPIFGFGAVSTKSKPVTLSSNDIAALSALISTFDVSQDPQGLKIEIRNANGQQKPEILTTKTEEFEEYSKYSFFNPHQKNHKLDLFIFEKVKPSLLEDRDLNNSIDDISDLRFDLQVLVDAASKKTIKSKMVVYYKDLQVAEGGVEDNALIKITNDLSKQVKNGKLQEMKITKNLMNSYKRSMDLEVKYIQGNKLLKQRLSLNLQNIKQTPIIKVIEQDEIEDIEEDLNLEPNLENEGNTNETNNTNS